jgi:hypothetical protein
MRISVIVGGVLAVLVAAYGLRVNARPKKIDYHSAICQKVGGPAAAGTVTYTATGIDVSLPSGKVSVVCPLEHVTNGDEHVANVDATFKIWVKGPTVTNNCQLSSVGSTFASITGFPSTLGVLSATAVLPVPTEADADPISLHVLCEFTGVNTLGTIEVKMVDHP